MAYAPGAVAGAHRHGARSGQVRRPVRTGAEGRFRRSVATPPAATTGLAPGRIAAARAPRGRAPRPRQAVRTGRRAEGVSRCSECSSQNVFGAREQRDWSLTPTSAPHLRVDGKWPARSAGLLNPRSRAAKPLRSLSAAPRRLDAPRTGRASLSAFSNAPTASGMGNCPPVKWHGSARRPTIRPLGRCVAGQPVEAAGRGRLRRFVHGQCGTRQAAEPGVGLVGVVALMPRQVYRRRRQFERERQHDQAEVRDR